MRASTNTVDGEPLSENDLAQLEADTALRAEQRQRAVRVIAGFARDVDDCRLLLDILGLRADLGEDRSSLAS